MTFFYLVHRVWKSEIVLFARNRVGIHRMANGARKTSVANEALADKIAIQVEGFLTRPAREG